MLFHNYLNPTKFTFAEISLAVELHGPQPEFGRLFVTLNMNMWTFSSIRRPKM